MVACIQIFDEFLTCRSWISDLEQLPMTPGTGGHVQLGRYVRMLYKVYYCVRVTSMITIIFLYSHHHHPLCHTDKFTNCLDWRQTQKHETTGSFGTAGHVRWIEAIRIEYFCSMFYTYG
jgi:hypothetical protein